MRGARSKVCALRARLRRKMPSTSAHALQNAHLPPPLTNLHAHARRYMLSVLTFIAKCTGVGEAEFEGLVHEHGLSFVVYEASLPPSLAVAAEASSQVDELPARRCVVIHRLNRLSLLFIVYSIVVPRQGSCGREVAEEHPPTYFTRAHTHARTYDLPHPKTHVHLAPTPNPPHHTHTHTHMHHHHHHRPTTHRPQPHARRARRRRWQGQAVVAAL